MSTLTITTTTLADRERYVVIPTLTVVLTYTGGTGGNVWTISAGTLPPGIAISNLDLGGGVVEGQLTGTPTTPGVYTFTVLVTDNTAHTDTQVLVWTITELYFPSPTRSSIPWTRFKQQPKDYTAITVSHTYDDEGKSFNTSTPTAPTFWEIGYTGLTYTQSQVFDLFNDEARTDRIFNLIDKWSVTWTGVRIVSYARDHEAHKSWIHACTFTLAKYP